MLIDKLNITLADLMPIKGVAVSLPGEAAPYRISERLHAALKNHATENGLMLSHLVSDLRNEVHERKIC
jgi:hypothetical protein